MAESPTKYVEFTYPRNDLQQRRRLCAVLGSFWCDVYDGRAQVTDYAQARGRLEQQGYIDLQEIADASSRNTVPVLHTEQWYRLTLKESSRETDEAALLRFDENGVFGQSSHFYGVPVEGRFAYPVPTELAAVSVITNRITEPSVTFIDGIEYVIHAKHSFVEFLTDPFKNDLIPKSDVWQAGEVVDREVYLWLRNAKFDHSHIHTHFSYALGKRLRSTPESRNLLNAVFDTVTGGTAKKEISDALSALSGIPLARDDETVIDVVKDHSHLLVITDKHVYRFSKTATSLVVPQDVVVPGQALVDALQIFELNRGQFPASIRAISLEEGYLATGYLGHLQFENKEETLTVVEAEDDATARTRISFPLGGHPEDAEKFFDAAHANGITRGKTLANLLDLRTNQVGEPTATNLPTTINPLKFLVENVLRGNVFIATLKVGDFGDGALGFEDGHFLRQMIPPHTGMLLLLELQGFSDSVTLGNDVETLGTFTGLAPLSDQIAEGTFVGTERVSIHVVSEACQPYADTCQ